MEEPITPVRKAKRIETPVGGEARSKTVSVSDEAFTQVEKNAIKLKMSKSRYVSAAIAFFAESGLNPVAERAAGLAAVEHKVSQQTRRVLEQNADVANRIIAIIRGWEKSSYVFHQQQQAGLINYLAQIENKILNRMVGQETHIFKEIIDAVVQTKIEAYINRSYETKIYSMAVDGHERDYDTRFNFATAARDKEMAEDLKKYMNEHLLPNMVATPRPEIVPIPAKIMSPNTVPKKPEATDK